MQMREIQANVKSNVFPTPPDEAERLQALYGYKLLDTQPDPRLDAIVELAAMTMDTPTAFLSLVDAERQWFKGAFGSKLRETPRSEAFCAYTILSPEPMVIQDSLADARFSDKALVRNPPHYRFYAGVPLVNGAGHAIGSLCVLDTCPRSAMPEQLRALQLLADLAMKWMESGDVVRRLALAHDQIKALRGLLPICGSCKGIRDDAGYWYKLESYAAAHSNAVFSHGLCPTCRELQKPAFTATPLGVAIHCAAH